MHHCCLIGGGGGFIGSYVTGALLAQGRQVTILDTRPAPRALPRAATYVVGDYGNKEMLRKALTGADAVINLSYASVLDSAKLHADSGGRSAFHSVMEYGGCGTGLRRTRMCGRS